VSGDVLEGTDVSDSRGRLLAPALLVESEPKLPKLKAGKSFAGVRDGLARGL
jgi:hypothetical protein